MEEQDIKRTVRYWLDGALYDLDTAKSLLEAKRYPHSLFFGHLVLEKLLKAVFVNKHGQHAPLTHSLVLLAEKSGIEISEEELGRLAEFTQFNIEGRYPEEKESFYQTATRDFTVQRFEELKEMTQWLRGILKIS